MAFPLHARYAHPENGWQADQETAARHLTPGEVYTIRRLDVGSFTSWLTFCETPADVAFNSVQFDAAEDEEPTP
jgi:hypothetical protein